MFKLVHERVTLFLRTVLGTGVYSQYKSKVKNDMNTALVLLSPPENIHLAVGGEQIDDMRKRMTICEFIIQSDPSSKDIVI